MIAAVPSSAISAEQEGAPTRAGNPWILADDPIGLLSNSQVYWHLDAYPNRAAADADKGPRGIVVASFGKAWLMTIADEKWRSPHGNRIAEIGPISVTAGIKYSAEFLEAIFTPGMITPDHIHPAPGAFFTIAGATCLETSDGRVQTARAGDPPIVIPEGLAMRLTAVGTEER